jgi:adenine-specific DNA-methyltransferase
MPARTELIWDGKYDPNGKRVAPFRSALPFQTVETVNESSGERKTLFSALDREKPWRNRLVWGDKKFVLPSLLPEFAGKVNLIYIDPPFDTGADFSFNATVHDGPDDGDEDGASFTKQPSVIEQKAYRDTWGRGIDSYLQWFYETVVILHELLAENGSIYVHIGPNMSHYCKVILDEILGGNNYRNEVVWKRAFGHSDSGYYGIIHDSILFYTKTDGAVWNQLLQEPDVDYINTFFDQYDDERKERYQRLSLSAGGLSGGGYRYEYKGVYAHWRCPLSTLEKHDMDGRLHWPKKGVPRLKKYESDYEGAPRPARIIE